MHAPPRFETRAQDRVGFWEKSAIGAGYLPVFFGYAAINSFAIPVYQMTLHIDPKVLAIALVIPRFWDAFTDPLMGLISDNTQSRFGRRRPYIVIGAILQAIAFGLIWMAPTTWSHTATIAYLITTLIIFYTCFTVYSVPLASLTYEMTPDPQERTRVSAFAGFFHKSGEFLYQWVYPLTGLAIFASAMQGVRVVGWCVAVLVFAGLGMLPGLFVKERYFQRAAKQDKVKLLPSLRASMRNRAFVVLVGLTILQIVAGMFASNIDYYVIVYHMNAGDVVNGSIWKGILSSGYAVVGIAMIFPVNWLAHRIGKRATLMVAYVFTLVGAIGKWVLFTGDHSWPMFEALDRVLEGIGVHTPGNFWQLLIDPLFCGPVWVAIQILTISMLADICDEDELQHGFRREGVFSSIHSWIQKLGYSLAFFGALWSLELTGFNAALGGAQSDGSILGMRLILTISTAIWALLALALLCYYPLTAARAYANRDALEARRGTVT